MSKFRECHFNYCFLTCSKILTIFQIVELQSPSLTAHLTIGVKGGCSMGLTLLHDDRLNTSLILPGDAISTLIFFWGVCVRNMHHHFWFLMYVCNFCSLSTYRKNTWKPKTENMHWLWCCDPGVQQSVSREHTIILAVQHFHACNWPGPTKSYGVSTF